MFQCVCFKIEGPQKDGISNQARGSPKQTHPYKDPDGGSVVLVTLQLPGPNLFAECAVRLGTKHLYEFVSAPWRVSNLGDSTLSCSVAPFVPFLW